MGRRGPPKKPDEIKAAQGNPGQHALNHEAPDYEIDTKLECPKELGAAGAAEWRRVAPMLIDYGVLRKSDLVAFTTYCKILDDVQYYETVRESFKKSKIEDDVRLVFQSANMLVKLRTQLRHYAQDLGLTPASRGTVKAKRPKGKQDAEAQKKKADVVRLFKVPSPVAR